MSVEEAIQLILENEAEKGAGMLGELFKKDPETFVKDLSKALAEEKLTFEQCSSIALTLRSRKMFESSIAVYKELITQEEKLENCILREQNPANKTSLIGVRERMRLSLGRDYNDLAVTYMDTNDRRNAKDMILKAYNEDVTHQKLYQAALMPAYRNLSSILIWEASDYYQKQDYFPSFLMSWISIELSLQRLWFTLLEEKKYSKEKRDTLGRWDISPIVEVLCLLGKLSDQVKKDIDTFRGRRNDMIHATGGTPSSGETERAAALALWLTTKT